MARNYDDTDEIMLGVGISQDRDSAFLMDDDFIQAGIADLSVCFNEELLHKAVADRAVRGKLVMEAGSICIDDFLIGDDDLIFESSAAHVESPIGVTATQLSKVWCISEEDAKQTLNVTS